MKRTAYSNYVSYNMESYFSRIPEGPVRCLLCAGNLSKLVIKPSTAMDDPANSPDYDYGSSVLFTCNECHWWCVRESYEFVCTGGGFRYGCDYLIIGKTGNDESAQPWLKALEDPHVYETFKAHRRVLPKGLAAILEGGKILQQSHQGEIEVPSNRDNLTPRASDEDESNCRFAGAIE